MGPQITQLIPSEVFFSWIFSICQPTITNHNMNTHNKTIQIFDKRDVTDDSWIFCLMFILFLYYTKSSISSIIINCVPKNSDLMLSKVRLYFQNSDFVKCWLWVKRTISSNIWWVQGVMYHLLDSTDGLIMKFFATWQHVLPFICTIWKQINLTNIALAFSPVLLISVELLIWLNCLMGDVGHVKRENVPLSSIIIYI